MTARDSKLIQGRRVPMNRDLPLATFCRACGAGEHLPRTIYHLNAV